MIIYGINPVLEALHSQESRLQRIWISRGKRGPRLQEIVELARLRKVPVRFEAAAVLGKKTSGARHQDVVAEATSVPYTDLEELLRLQPRLLLLLDGVEDPQNLGAVLRTAEAAGVEGVLLPERRTCGITATVVKASAGAAMHLRLAQVGNVSRTVQQLKDRDFWIVGLDPRGRQTLQQVPLELPLLLVVGSEHRGMRRRVREQCDFLLSLPMKGQVASLNLSVAAGILMYLIVLGRQEAAAGPASG